ncbi:MAG: type II toxin-antitoxin system RelB/DinJ family antitoxin [Burkholderiales bacterium]|nr:type II toxin-antitoxin system RelB/DinJ family antitoxin [Burkholderiales bacterium]
MKTIVKIRIDKEIKDQFSELCEELGINIDTAINVFARAMLRAGGFPFRIALEEPNKETREAFFEAQDREVFYGPFKTAKEMMESLNAE